MAEYTEKMRKGKEIIIRAACVVLVIGLGIMAFPYIKQWLYDRNAREQIREFEGLMEEIRGNVPERADLEIRQKYNNLFHQRIVNIGGNRLIESIYSSILDLIGDQIFQTDGTEFYSSHMRIFEAIRERKPDEAAFYMADHFHKKFPNYRYYKQIHALS